MSDKPISKGDLVMVVRGHTCDLGRVFAVTDIGVFPTGWTCRDCGARDDSEVTAALYWEDRGDPISWLKRLDPDNLMDDIPTNEELTV